jgi:hypothetical protein
MMKGGFGPPPCFSPLFIDPEELVFPSMREAVLSVRSYN